jgi:hypothetical protein
MEDYSDPQSLGGLDMFENQQVCFCICVRTHYSHARLLVALRTGDVDMVTVFRVVKEL